jgi:hypothetical protein
MIQGIWHLVAGKNCMLEVDSERNIYLSHGEFRYDNVDKALVTSD